MSEPTRKKVSLNDKGRLYIWKYFNSPPAPEYEVIDSPDCDCNYEPLDPDSSHLIGCAGCYTTIYIPGEGNVVMANAHLILK